MKMRYVVLAVLVALAALSVVACDLGAGPTATPVVITKEVPKEVTKIVEKQVTVVVQATPAAQPAPAAAALTVPFLADWMKSGHADAKAQAFTNWTNVTGTLIPMTCVKCHSSDGYRDFLGADGSLAGSIQISGTKVSVIDCVACHNPVTINKTSVKFPSGVTLSDLGDEARCMECHQGRQSTTSVNAAIATAGLTNTLDTVPVTPTLGFLNIHYYAAAATQYGTLAKGGYEYAGKSYEAKFEHVEGFNTCNSCHNPHTLEVELAKCQTCHTDVKAKADLIKIRMNGSLMDYDGDGDKKEGVQSELLGLQEKLYTAVVAYSKIVGKGQSIAYSSAANPYFFIDTNGDGKADEKEAVSANRWTAWTARLLKAAYNYNVSKKDPGTFAHNGKYIIQLLYDSIEDLNTQLPTKVDISKAHRDDAGHFSGAGPAFTRWFAQGEVPVGCAKCHSATGLPEFIKNGGTVAITAEGTVATVGIGAQQPKSGFTCTTCHNDVSKFTVYPVVNVPFPSGKNVTFSTEKDDKGALKPVAANLCLECHQGRESTTTVNMMLTGLDDDKVDAKVRFRNVHYYAAGASLFGDLAQGAYQYTGKKYLGKFAHVPGFDTCTGCHNTHELELRMDKCVTCHPGVTSPRQIRLTTVDYDGDKDVKEPVSAEVDGLAAKLYTAILDYSKTITTTAIGYSPTAYPYYFKDTNGDGKIDEKEGVSANGWSAWTPRLLRAAYNYQYIKKDPGVFAHNARYAVQILYDALEDLGVKVKIDLTGLTRPQ